MCVEDVSFVHIDIRDLDVADVRLMCVERHLQPSSHGCEALAISSIPHAGPHQPGAPMSLSLPRGLTNMASMFGNAMKPPQVQQTHFV